MPSPLISVIVPIYNMESLLRRPLLQITDIPFPA